MKRMNGMLTVLFVGLLAVQAGAYTSGFDGGYTLGALVGQSNPVWDYSTYGSDPSGSGDSWLNSANVAVDPANAANHAAQFFGDCSGGATHGASASVVVSVGSDQDITFSQSGYWPSSNSASQSLCMSALTTSGCQWGGAQNLTFGNYGYFVKRYDATIWEGITNGNMVAWSLWNSSTGNYESILVPKDTWVAADVTFHLATQTADMTVTYGTNVQQIPGIPVAYIGGSGLVNGLTRYDIYTDGESNVAGSIYLDNVMITPEPVTLSLMALGGLALLRRRK